MDTPRQHAEGWRLAAESGRLDEAREDARRYSLPPATLADLLALAEGFESLEMPEDALRCVEAYGTSPDPSGAIALCRARALIRLGRTTELHRLAVGLRHPEFFATQAGLSELLEGIVDAHRGRADSALERLRTAMESGIVDDGPGRDAVCGLMRLEGARAARRILREMPAPSGKETELRHLVECL
jgi:hypothetical protein